MKDTEQAREEIRAEIEREREERPLSPAERIVKGYQDEQERREQRQEEAEDR